MAAQGSRGQRQIGFIRYPVQHDRQGVRKTWFADRLRSINRQAQPLLSAERRNSWRRAGRISKLSTERGAG